MLAGEQTQRTVARLSQQLRRFLDDKSYYENRRISRLLDEIEHKALELRDNTPEGVFMEMDGLRPEISLPMEHPLFTPSSSEKLKADFETIDIEAMNDEALFNQVVVDKAEMKRNIRLILQRKDQATLSELLEEHPLEEGLAELVTYLSIAEESLYALVDEENREELRWIDKGGVLRSANVPRILFNRSRNGK